jgi:ATP-dependent DNA helicase DinG
MGTDIAKYSESFFENTRRLFHTLNFQIENQINTEPQMKEAERFSLDFNDEINNLIEKQSSIINSIYNIIGLYYDDSNATETMRQAVNEFEEILTFFKNIKDSESYLVWLEKKARKIELYVCPKKIDRITKRLFFSHSRQTILTSATLSDRKGGTEEEIYNYFVKNTGFPYSEHHGILATPQPSPFPYDKNALIYYTSNLPHPTDERDLFIEEGTKIVVDLIKISGGKALILFTSKEDMNLVYQKLFEIGLPYKILMQSPGSSQEDTLNAFREDISSILLGTGAYWEGIDIKGISLSNVIIFKLPFPVPDPIIKYKCSIVNDKLMEVLVPEMIMKLNQGIGRLIRSSTDKGIVSIIDPRLSKESKYNDIVWMSLPIKNKTDSITELKHFYDEVLKS